MKNRRHCALVLAAVMVLCLVLTACGGPTVPTTTPADPTTVPTQPTQPKETTYTVTVSADNGMKLSGIGVWIYTDSSMTEMIWFDKTNADGVMSFVAKTSDKYVLALQNVPEGYEVETSYAVTEQTDVVLKTVIQQGGQIGKHDLSLGDVMVDFSVTTVDGSTLNFVDMLAANKAIVLNFFYNECVPCQMEFPMLQQAYAQYADELVVVAMNPINTDAAATQALADSLGLTFPMALCEYGWETALHLQSYPTTVVIDRYGIISLIHTGSITEVGVFENIFAFFTAEDYVQTVVTDLDEITGEPEAGTKENPIELGAILEFEGNVQAGSALYYEIFKISGMILEIHTESMWVEYEGKKYYPENGIVSMEVFSPDPYTPVNLVIGNDGNKDQVFHAYLSFPLGTNGNPIVLTPGFFTTNVEKGNDQGVWYTYTAEQTGTIRLGCMGATDGVGLMYAVYNIATYTYVTSDYETLTDPETGERYILVAVSAGDVLQITVGTLPDEEYQYPAAQIEMVLSYSQEAPVGPPVDPTEPTEPEDPPQETVYVVVVVDDQNNPVPGVEVLFSAFDDMAIKLTDADGVAEFVDTSMEVSFQITAPAGYEAPEMVYPVLSPDRPVFLVTLQKVAQQDPSVEPPVDPTEPTDPVEPPVEMAFTELYVGRAYHVSVGSNEVSLVNGDVNYFLFYPENAGLYQVSASSPEAILSYWGGNIHFITDLTHTTDLADNVFTINVKPSMMGQGFILGITGSGSCTLQLERLSDAVLDETDAPWDVYESKTPIVSVTVEKPADKTLIYVDVSRNTADYTLVYSEATGCYHLNAADGPVVYVNLKSAPDLSFSALIQYTGLHVYYYDEAGNFVNKVDFTGCVAEYVAHCDTKGLYPLNDDLIHILQECNRHYGWWDAENPNFLLFGVDTVNPEIAWMFPCCYYA